MVLIGGMHGNEPAGPIAIARVLGELEERDAPLSGRVVGLAGNLGALQAGRRYLARDLNRGWTRAEVAALFDPASGRDLPEDREQRDLLRIIVPLMAEAREPVVFLDLHSTSGESPPFTCLADVLRNRTVGLAFPLPLVLGIEEILDGTLLGYFCDLGHVAVAVEGGQSRDPRTLANHECAIWSTLVAVGALGAKDVPELEARRARLREAAGSMPAVVEIRHRHLVREGDGFEMPFWLRLSAWLRRARIDRLVPLLPGVRRHPTEPDRFLVDPRVARWQVVNVFHLFGYRHVREAGDRLVFSRRRPGFRRLDTLPPELLRLSAGPR